MIEVKADPEEMRMLIRLDRALAPEEFQQVIEDIKVEADKLGNEWVAAVDLRGMWVSDPYLINRFKMLQETLLFCGAGKIATLVDNWAVQMQLGQAGMKSHSNAITKRFYRQQEWEAFIALP